MATSVLYLELGLKEKKKERNVLIETMSHSLSNAFSWSLDLGVPIKIY